MKIKKSAQPLQLLYWQLHLQPASSALKTLKQLKKQVKINNLIKDYSEQQLIHSKFKQILIVFFYVKIFAISNLYLFIRIWASLVHIYQLLYKLQQGGRTCYTYSHFFISFHSYSSKKWNKSRLATSASLFLLAKFLVRQCQLQERKVLCFHHQLNI